MSESAIEYVRSAVLPAALSMLPPHMDSTAARAMVLAIGMQESRFAYRRQLGGGPALGFWEGEITGGYRGILKHPATREYARGALKRMAYGEPDASDFLALEHNDILAGIGARLLLFTHPKALPEGDSNEAWRQYIDCWRPGKPRRDTFDAFYLDAWSREVNS
jgi:hypothetical protein